MLPSPESNLYPGPNHLQRLIDEEILHLKTRRNACAAVSKLPDDVLGEIFTNLAHSAPLPSWYQINFVCGRWRDTALETVALWTRPCTRHYDLAVLMLERAKAADVYLDFGKETPLATATAILNRAGRIRALAFDEPPYSLQDVKGLERFRERDSELRSLSVCFRQNAWWRPLPPSQRFDWNLLPLPSLAHLTLESSPLLDLITIEHLLLTFGDMPSLESVKIHSDIISQQTPLLPFDHPSVRLPCLRSMDINWDISTQHIINLFSHLRLPQLCELKMNIITGKEGGSNVEHSPFLRTVSSLILQGNFGTLDKLAVDDDWFSLTSEDQAKAPGMVLQDVEIHVIDYDALENARAQNFPHEVFAALDDHVISHLTQLRFLAPFWTIVEDVIPLFQRFDNLQSIGVACSFISVLTAALLTPPHHSAVIPITVFPKLQEINIYGAVDDSQMVRAFCDALKDRQRHGIPIGKLHFRHYDRPDDNILLLCSDIGIEITLNDL